MVKNINSGFYRSKHRSYGTWPHLDIGVAVLAYPAVGPAVFVAGLIVVSDAGNIPDHRTVTGNRFAIQKALRTITVKLTTRPECQHVLVTLIALEMGNIDMSIVTTTVVRKLPVIGFDVVTVSGIGC